MEVKEKNPWGKIPPGKKAIPVFTDPKIQRRFLWAIDEEKNNVYFLGRLANYKYFNMDQAIKNSLDYYQKYFKN